MMKISFSFKNKQKKTIWLSQPGAPEKDYLYSLFETNLYLS